MPLYIVHCLDRKDALAKRKQVYEEHRAYIGTASSKRITMIMSGPLVHQNNNSAGSCYLMEAPDIETVKAFNAGRPVHRQRRFRDGAHPPISASRALEPDKILDRGEKLLRLLQRRTMAAAGQFDVARALDLVRHRLVQRRRRRLVEFAAHHQASAP